MRAAVLGWVVAILTISGGVARGDTNRYAVIIGANRGDRTEVTLRHAVSDGRRIGTILQSIGDFRPEDVIAVDDGSADDVEHAIKAVNDRIEKAGGESVLFVFYSGHADAESLHLGDSRLSWQQLRALVAASPATVRVVVIDACRSGELTRVKGGRPGPSFDVRVEASAGPHGVAMLTSSAASEDSQESDELGASFFTHYLASALLGAADRDRDGKVTLAEAFAYASERTLSATIDTFAGPQHPTYQIELGGRADLVLTRPGSPHVKLGTLQLAEPGSYLVRAGANGPIVAELATDTARGQLALEPGRYQVTRRDADHLLRGDFVIAIGATTVASPDHMRRLDYAEVVRKGGTSRRVATSVFTLGGARGEILDLGTAWDATVGARLDLPRLSLEVRGDVADSQHVNAHIEVATRETALSLAAVRTFDLDGLATSVGLELGAAWLAQSFSNARTADRDGYATFVAPVLHGELPFVGRTYLRFDLAVLTYFLRADQMSGIENAVTFRAGTGIGMYF